MDRHYTPEELARYADDLWQAAGRAEEIGAHLERCSECREILAFIRSFDESLGAEETWHFADELLDGRNQRKVTDLEERIKKEDEAAARMLRSHLTSPLRFVWSNIHRKRRFLSGGVVRALAAESAAAREVSPLHALNLADAAVAIADALPDDYYPARGVQHLRGLAWKERANACHYLGLFDAALDALDHASRAYRRLLVHDTELAVVHFIRGTILWKRQQLDQALTIAQESAVAFSNLRDHERWVNAKLLEGAILTDLHASEAARDVFRSLYEDAEAIADPTTRARIANNLATTYLDLEDTGRASQHFLAALQLYESLGLATEVARVRWSIGLMALVAGNYAEAIRRLTAAKIECDHLGMTTDAALVRLDLAEALLLFNEHADIRRLAGEALYQAQKAGMLPAVFTAISYLREAATARTLTPEGVRHVKRFVRHLEAEPHLLFQPPRDDRRG